MAKIQPFYVKRKVDETGVSGTGIVAIGAEFYPSGVCVLKWLSAVSSIGIYDTIDELKEIHGHNGKTEIIMGDIPDDTKVKKRKKNEK